ncbi:hypothetical protein EG329_008830 [Mollisiaceae sp. DMI_Dod_QoI]|nr:hypothetical protein EG329_008830 [Helotiales sp. DMI_Dod_QoI]
MPPFFFASALIGNCLLQAMRRLLRSGYFAGESTDHHPCSQWQTASSHPESKKHQSVQSHRAPAPVEVELAVSSLVPSLFKEVGGKRKSNLILDLRSLTSYSPPQHTTNNPSPPPGYLLA